MNATEFILKVQVKLNRLDSSSYQDVRPEEVLFFAYNALKALTLSFDLGFYSQLVNTPAILVYLASITKHVSELPLTNNAMALNPNILKIKDLKAYVKIGDEEGWQETREFDNERTSDREDNPFLRSFPDTPVYRLIDNTIKFDVNGFECTKVQYDYLVAPAEIRESDTLTYPFMTELEDKTVTLILENLEARRLQTQPAVSKS